MIDLRKSCARKVISHTFCFSPLDLVIEMSPMKEDNLSELGNRLMSSTSFKMTIVVMRAIPGIDRSSLTFSRYLSVCERCLISRRTYHETPVPVLT